MNRTAEDFFHSIKDRHVAFIGVGVSHTDCIRLFARKGIRVTVCDRREASSIPEREEFERLGVTMRCGEGYLDGLSADIIFRTPGMYFGKPEIAQLRKDAIVTSEMELFFRLCPCRIYAVTGSDGKTTTTSLIAALLSAAGKRVWLGGNIGKALLPLVEEMTPEDCAVVELSSFQLMSMRQSPDVAVITNITPNHLDVHSTMEEYINCKRNLLLHQDGFGRAILNLDDPTAYSLAGDVRGQLRAFSYSSRPELGAFLREDGILCWQEKGAVTPLFDKKAIRIPGEHNVENFLTAITALYGDIDPTLFEKVAREFPGVEHRIEFVRELRGVRYYNDSIATSPTRTIAGLRSFDVPLILIAGGYDKKIPFEPLAEPVCQNVRVLILTGVTADKIKAAVTSCPAYDPEKLTIFKVSCLEDAVKLAADVAKEGEVVTLSPACASFDAFKNFEVRGNYYKDLVNKLD
ncbi:MAG: UDP-N-acetylmuramoyl-L-alanine--D-glutamate ligase [Ruminococcaceae bacterium]|nr:UDP-N-acetylmuramoyl-L-alanine--D-glutamate ligase [Oscillospiraceae bacterium]